MSGVVINRQGGTRAITFGDPRIPSFGPMNPAKIGSGVTSTNSLLIWKGRQPLLRILRRLRPWLFDCDTLPASQA
jgi:hypothetical protein